jgi:hypothetical protein
LVTLATPLRAVAVNERVKPPVTIKAAADLSERALLVALRDKLAGELDSGGVPAHAIKGIISELRDVDRSIRALDQRESGVGSVVADTNDESFDATSV